MQAGPSFFNFLAGWEGQKLCPYRDSTGKPTIGIGCTFYENGKPVTMNDPCISEERKVTLCKNILKDFEAEVTSLLSGLSINQNQFEACLSFAFNEGTGNFRASTLLKKTRKNVSDPTIRDEFMRWVYVFDPKKGKKVVSDWQVKRRKGESNLYFKPIS